jgi:hypothetical protein
MRHDWVFDVLLDLKSYAMRNDLPQLAASVDQALAVARSEIEAEQDRAASPTGHMGPGRSRQPH